MEAFFNTIFQDVRHERNLVLLLSLVELDILRQSKITDYEITFSEEIALQKLHRVSILKEYYAVSLLK